MVSFDFDTLREDGRAKWNLFTAKGKSGDQEQWVLTGSSSLGNCAAQDVYEFMIPWAEIGLAPRYTTRVKVVSSWAESLSYGDGIDMEVAPPAPAELILPDLEEWVTLLELEDQIGDETGDGDYIYPLASDFATPGDGGLWDAQKVTIRQSAWNAQFIIEMGEMTDIWGLSNGFSHQIVQIYVDQGNTSFGNTEMLSGANAEIHPDWAWEVAISGTGEPGAVMSVQADTGSTSARGIDVSGDTSTNTIIFTVSKGVIGEDIPNYRYIIVIGSQDGFGTGKWRDVDATPTTWTLGGGENPASDDGVDYDPNIIDVILDGAGQQTMLSSYDVDGHIYAQLTGFEMPEIAQQIYGFKYVSSTSSTALLEWSTTKPASGRVDCITPNEPSTSTTLSQPWVGQGLTHAITMANLSSGVEYECQVFVDSLSSESVNFTTSTVVDTTAPDLLNLAVEVLEDGRARISWYTSESSTEQISLNQQIVYQDNFATKKNHQFTTEPLLNGEWSLEVVSLDASGNSNSSTAQFIVNIEGQDNQGDGQVDSTDSDEETSSVDSSTVIQIGLLVVILLLVVGFIRVRQSESSDDDKWS